MICATLFLMLVVVVPACTQVTNEDQQADPIYTFARQRVEETRRQQATQMPAWLKENREVLRDQMAVVAQKSFAETGIWFLARGAGRGKDEQETAAVWGDRLELIYSSAVHLKNLKPFTYIVVIEITYDAKSYFFD